MREAARRCLSERERGRRGLERCGGIILHTRSLASARADRPLEIRGVGGGSDVRVGSEIWVERERNGCEYRHHLSLID